MKKKLCVIFSVASHYRESIYKEIDQEYDCDWYFSDEDAGVKSMDLSLLKNTEIKHFKKIGRRLNAIEGIQYLLSDKRYDTYLMLFGTVCVSIWWFLLKAKLFYPKKKIYLWGHGWYGKETRIEKIIKRMILKAAAGVFVYGNYSKSMARKMGCDTDKIHVIHNSLHYEDQMVLRKQLVPSDIYRTHFNNSNPTIIFIGRLTYIKKLHQLIEALSILISKGEQYNLVFVGDGTERVSLEKLAKEKGISENIWFYGASYDEKTNAELIFNSDLCVSPGNVGLTGVHTMMFGTPVITHNNFPWQMPEFETIIPGETGDFFVQNDVTDLADTISRWLKTNSNNRDQIRQRCFEVIDTDWNPYAQIEVIKSVIK